MNRFDTCERLLACALVLVVSALGGAWAVLCQSEEHVAIENLFRDCCREHVEPADMIDVCSDETCITCRQHTRCSDTPLTVIGIVAKQKPERVDAAVSPVAILAESPDSATTRLHDPVPDGSPPAPGADILSLTTVLRI